MLKGGEKAQEMMADPGSGAAGKPSPRRRIPRVGLEHDGRDDEGHATDATQAKQGRGRGAETEAPQEP